MKDHMSVYENAVISIKLGIQDYQSSNPERHISAVRNFYAGVVLLGKYCLLTKLKDEDAKQVLATNYKPVLNEDSEISYVPKGHQTIDLNDLQIRFKDFGLDWPKINIVDLQRLRNNLEHFHSFDTLGQIQQIIAGCFPLVEAFLEIIGDEPIEILEDSWKVMLDEKSFFNEKKKSCDISFSRIVFKEISPPLDVTCDNCESLLIFQDDPINSDPNDMKIKCKSCGDRMFPETFIKKLIENHFGIDDYRRIKSGESASIHNCPFCYEDGYVYTGSVNECYLCGESISSECARCSVSLTVENLSCENNSCCDYCAHMMSKDD